MTQNPHSIARKVNCEHVIFDFRILHSGRCKSARKKWKFQNMHRRKANRFPKCKFQKFYIVENLNSSNYRRQSF